ncbi:UNVERIFIED_CONTAM: hypothetical protein Scaly_1612100 [Sesamum calycinum]|uniref:Uncharacterized protein n=1 Tax=Sesamum calycinum TaxID=2727403 RepID=A0AAW2P879_9LAMI
MPNIQVAETNVEEIIAMVSNLHISMVTQLNIAVAIKSFEWWYDSRATFLTIDPEMNNKSALIDAPTELRRSQRPRKAKKLDPDLLYFLSKEAVNDEMDSLLANNTWVLTDLPLSSKAIGRNGLSRFTNNSSIEHWKGIRTVFVYLKGTANLRLFYNRFPAVLEGYSDASWITSIGNNKSTSGRIFNLAGGAVAWVFPRNKPVQHILQWKPNLLPLQQQAKRLNG